MFTGIKLPAFFASLFSFILVVNAQHYPLQWDASGLSGGGAVYSPSINPHDPNEVFLGCDMGLMLHTNDFGNNWNTMNFNTLIGHRHTKVNFTNHPDTMYVEKQDKYTSKNYPAISVDGGVNWQTIPSTAFWGNFGSFRLYANPNNSRQVIASSFSNIYFSNNWGSSFTSIHSASGQGSTFVHLAGVLYTNDTVFVSTDKGWIISPDLGNNWNPFVNYNTMGIATGVGNEAVVSFSGAVTGSQTRFICTTIAANSLSVKTEPRDIQYFQKLYRMDINAVTGIWTDLTVNLKNADMTLNNYNFAYQVTMNKNNIDTFYLTGQTRSPAMANVSKFGTVFKTTNGGNSFINIFLKNNNLTNAGMTTGWVGAANTSFWEHSWNSINTTEGLCIDPNNINRLMRSDFSIVCVSEDGGANWDQRYVAGTEHAANSLINLTDLYETNGLQTTVCHSVHWLTPSRVLMTYSDLLMNESNDGGYSWGYLYDSLWSPKVNDIGMLCMAASGRIYAPEGETLGNNGDWSDHRLGITNAGKLTYSDDGQHWHLMKDFQNPVSWAAMAQNDDSRIYVTVLSELSDPAGGIWKCTGLPGNPVWSKLNDPPRTQKRPTQIFVLNNGDLLAVFGARDSSTAQPISYSFTASSGVFISTDDGNSWTDLCAAYPAMQKDARFLTIDPADPLQDTWLVGMGSSGIGSVSGLYRTSDRGGSWTNVWSGNSVVSCTMNPIYPDEMYVCTTNDGLFYATSANSDFPVINPVEEYPFRSPEKVFFNPYNSNEVWVTSLGNGLRIGTTAASFLPVELVDFKAGCLENSVEFAWSVESEELTKNYYIEKSSNGAQWETIAMINSTDQGTYSYTDYETSSGLMYYRLSAAEFNGSIHDFEIMALECSGAENEITVFPNPGRGEFTVSGVKKDTELIIYNQLGQAVYYQLAAAGNIVLNIPDIISGIYLLKIRQGDSVIFKKVLIEK